MRRRKVLTDPISSDSAVVEPTDTINSRSRPEELQSLDENIAIWKRFIDFFEFARCGVRDVVQYGNTIPYRYVV